MGADVTQKVSRMKRVVYALAVAAFAVVTSLSVETVIDRGPHTTVVEKTWDNNGETNLVASRYTILQPGLNYYSPQDNAWKPTSTDIDLAQVGASYAKGPFKLDFAPNVNDAVAPVTLTLPDTRKIKIKTIGIALTAANGDSVWLGEIKDSNGLLDGNTIIYPDAFTGLKADIVVKVSVGKYESDVVLREQIIAPQTFGFDPTTAVLEIWHKVIESPDAEIAVGHIPRKNGTIDQDQQVGFGDMFIGEGSAFLVGTNNSPVSGPEGAIKVAKERFNDAGTQYLIEKIPYAEAIAHLQSLPARQEAQFDRDSMKRSILNARNVALRGHKGRSTRSVPISLAVSTLDVPSKPREKQVASVMRSLISESPGFVMDYSVLVAASNFRFRADTTYYCTNSINLTGSTIIEGGTVVKFPPYDGVSRLYIYGKVDCQTSPYSMAIFTADADNSVGEIISTNALSDYYAKVSLAFTGNNPYAQNLHDIRCSYANWGMTFYTPTSDTSAHNLSNVQFVHCWYGIESNDLSTNTCYVNARNMLFDNTMTPFYGNRMSYAAEHITARRANRFYQYLSGGSGAMYLTNSLLVQMTNSSSTFTSDHVTTLASDSGVFQALGAGANYLAANSSYRDAGTTTVSPEMLTILRKTTTYPPLELTGTVSVSTTLTPQVQRDTDLPDLGYHFYPLDYLWGNLTISPGTTLLLTNGVAVALHSTNATILRSDAKLISEGMPHLMNRFVRYQTVQEQPISYGTTGPNMTLVAVEGAPSIKPQIFFRFTEVGVEANASASRSFCSSSEFASLAFRDCRLLNLCDNYNPASGSAGYALTNNILERCDLSFVRSNNVHQMTVDLRNNYISRTALAFNYPTTTGSPPTWTLRDNFFDTVTLATAGSSTYVVCDHNGYYGTTIPALSGGNDKSPRGLDFQTGPLGPYYYPPTNAPSSINLFVLVDAGSRSSADASLYHYTTRGDQVKDLAAVDLGFHYVAVDSDGIPLDSDGDGIPDYLEDRNGNGVADSDESAWNSAMNNSTGLVLYTPLQP
jgi:hypothetical protein